MFWTLLIGLLLLVVGFFYLKLKLKKAQRYWPDRGIPVAASKRSILWMILTRDFDFVRSETLFYDQLKDTRFGGLNELFSHSLYLVDLDLIKQVYIKDFEHFVDRRGFETKKHDPHMHYSLFNQKGEAWKDLRSKMSPTFSTGKIRRMYQIFNSSAEKLVKALGDAAATSNPSDGVEIRPFVQKLTMDVIASSAFGVQTSVFEDPDSMFSKMGMRLQNTLSARNLPKLFVILFFPALADLFKLKLVDDEADRFLSKIIIETLERRQETGEVREDFLQLMIEARAGQVQREDDLLDESADKILEDRAQSAKIDFTDDLIIAQCLLFFLAGFDTTESMLTFALYEIACNPEVQEKLYREVKGAVDGNEGQFTYEIINKLEYLDMILFETLRRYPPAVRADRRCTKPYPIPGSDFVIPKDMVVAIPIYGIHHNPDIWPEPQKFIPERFSKSNSVGRHPCAFQPFGHGPRNCIGNRFALVEGKCALAHLILNFKLEPCAKTTIPIKLAKHVPLKPADDIPLKIVRR